MENEERSRHRAIVTSAAASRVVIPAEFRLRRRVPPCKSHGRSQTLRRPSGSRGSFRFQGNGTVTRTQPRPQGRVAPQLRKEPIWRACSSEPAALGGEPRTTVPPRKAAAGRATSGPLASTIPRRDDFRPRRSPAPWLRVLAMDRWPRRPPDPYWNFGPGQLPPPCGRWTQGR